MNPTPEIVELQPPSEDPTAPSAESPSRTANLTGQRHPAFGDGNRHNGKVARLPKAIRDQINFWLLDGLSYPDIIQRLGDHGKDLKPNHLYEWKKRGYQEWLLQRDWLEHLASKSEFSTEILAAPNSAGLHEAGLRIAAAQMIDQFMRLGAATDTGESTGQSDKFARLVNALSRLTREALAFQKYRDTCAKAVAAELKQLNIDRELSDNEYQLLINRMDKVFKVARRVPAPKSDEAGLAAPKLSEGGLAVPKPCEGGPPATSAPPDNGIHTQI